MLLGDVIEYLDINGVEYVLSEKALIFQEAPCCGGHNKLYLYIDDKEVEDDDVPLFGKCHKCDTTWNSRSFLLALGHEHLDVNKLHTGGDLSDFDLGSIPKLGINLATAVAAPVNESIEIDLSTFYPIPELPNHPASLYAKKRGWTESQKDDIMIEMMSNSVVFLCREGGKVVGWQKRYLKPPFPEMKTKTIKGFKKTQHIIEYPNKGDILVCEGPFTALSAWHYGYHGVCTFGAAVSERQLNLIADLALKTGKRVAVAFDLDKAGRKGYRIVRLSMYWKGIDSYKVAPEVGNDLNDSWQAGKGVIVVPSVEDDITIPSLDLEDLGVPSDGSRQRNFRFSRRRHPGERHSLRTRKRN